MDKVTEIDLERALDVVRNGGIILYPTDTIWGIGCDATNNEAIKRIFRLKRREDSKSMLSLVGSATQLSEWVKDIPQQALKLANESAKPMTVIYDTPGAISSLLIADDGSAGFRISRDPFSATLALKLGRPLVSTSANISGMPGSSCFSEIAEEIKEGVDYVCTTRRDHTTRREPSSIVKIHGDQIIHIR